MADFQCDLSAPSVIKNIKVTFDVRGGAFNPECPILIMAQMCQSDNATLGTVAGTATPLQPVQVFGDEDELFGERCEASLMVKRARGVSRNADIWVLPLPETGTAHVQRDDFGPLPPQATVIQRMIGGELYTVSYVPGMTRDDVAAAFAEEINADPNAGFHAASSGRILTVTANWPGSSGVFGYRNEYCRFGITPGMDSTITVATQGDGAPDIEAAFAAIGEDCFCDIVVPYPEAIAHFAARNGLCEAWAACSRCYSRGYVAATGTLAQQVARSAAMNSPHALMAGLSDFDEQPATLMAAVAAAVHIGLENNPYLPVDCVTIPGVTPPDKNEVPPESIIDTAAIDGLTHLQTLADGTVQINTGVSTYTRDNGGQLDLRYQNFNLLSVYRQVALYLSSRWSQTFDGYAFARPDYPVQPGQKVITQGLAEATIVGWLNELATVQGVINLPLDGDVQTRVDENCCFIHSITVRPLAPARCSTFDINAILKDREAA